VLWVALLWGGLTFVFAGSESALVESARSSVRGYADTLFVGLFGPGGIAAVYYATLVVLETGSRQVWQVTSLVIAASILAYGASATPFTKLYGGRNGQ
jgi:NhaP-type Na+/H+ or K+/H+ antiporter